MDRYQDGEAEPAESAATTGDADAALAPESDTAGEPDHHRPEPDGVTDLEMPPLPNVPDVVVPSQPRPEPETGPSLSPPLPSVPHPLPEEPLTAAPASASPPSGTAGEPPTGKDEAPAATTGQESAPPGGREPGLPIPGLPDPNAPDDDSGDEAFEISDLDDLVKAEPADARRVAAGSRCTGTIVAVNDSGVIVSFGMKVEGHVPIEEFRDANGNVSAEVGQEIDVLVERLGLPGEYAVLSVRRAREMTVWTRIEAAHANHEPVQATVVERIRGGLRVDIGVSGFLPGSQIDTRPVRNLDEWVGQSFEVIVLECNRRRSNVVVSRRELIKVAREAQLAATLEQLQVGEPATGVVKNITTYGVFVDLGGIDGLIKMTELSHGRVENPADLFEPGQEVTAMVLRVDSERGRVALSLRAMRPDPWATIEERYKPGDRLQGRVSSVTDYGAFVELESGVEGLIHISEIEWSQRPKHPSKTFTPGAETEVVVLDVKPAERRISLSFRQLVPDPWDSYAAGLEPGTVVEGIVRRIVDFGMFVEITEGLEGLVHVSDLAWDTRSRNPHDFAKKGQKINTVILNVDVENRRISLGVKQLEPDSWDTFLSQAAVGDTIAGLVRRLVKFGAFVELAPGVEGLCHRSQGPRGGAGLLAGQRYHFEIIEVNERSRRIGLRCESADPLDDDPAAGLAPESVERQPDPADSI